MIPQIEITDNLVVKAELDDGQKLNSTLGQLTAYEILCYANQVLRQKKISLWRQLMAYRAAKFGEQK